MLHSGNRAATLVALSESQSLSYTWLRPDLDGPSASTSRMQSCRGTGPPATSLFQYRCERRLLDTGIRSISSCALALHSPPLLGTAGSKGVCDNGDLPGQETRCSIISTRDPRHVQTLDGARPKSLYLELRSSVALSCARYAPPRLIGLCRWAAPSAGHDRNRHRSLSFARTPPTRDAYVEICTTGLP